MGTERGTKLTGGPTTSCAIYIQGSTGCGLMRTKEKAVLLVTTWRGHGAKEHGAKGGMQTKEIWLGQRNTGEALATWESEGTDMKANGQIKKGQWNERKLYLEIGSGLVAKGRVR